MMRRAMKHRLLLLLLGCWSLSAHATFVDNGDGTVTDTVTGLMWDKCPYGQTASDCSGGSAVRLTWKQALATSVAVSGISYKGHNDWRLPNVKELESLARIAVTHPGIDDVAFPNTDLTQWYWSSSLSVHDGYVWGVSFNQGDLGGIDWSLQANNSFARYVRGGSPNDAYDLVPASPPAFQNAVSRRAHGAAGTFDLPLSKVVPPAINHNPTTEPRQGPAQTIVFTFDKPINAAIVTVAEGVATAAAPTFAGNSVVVALTGVTDQQYVTVSLGNVASTDGSTGGSASVRVGFLTGDANSSRLVAVTDLVVVNNQLGKPLTALNFLSDVNTSGIITVLDKVVVNNNLGHFLPAP